MSNLFDASWSRVAFEFSEGTKDQLREHLIDELDYNLVPADGWHKLLEWYTISDGQVTFERDHCGCFSSS